MHRDIKPGNIMITDEGGVKVVDFGIARASAAGQQLTQTATVLGTAAYLSPEQATAAEVDGRADLYALGCVLHEMLTGAPPFTADTPVGIAFKQVTEEPARVSLRRPQVPPALDAVVLRLLAKRPADRPLNAAAARAELLAAIPGAGQADRTSELLTTMLPATGFPTPPPGYLPGAAHTSVMAPVPEPYQPVPEPYQQYGQGGQGSHHDRYDQHEPEPAARRPRRTLALVLGGVGLAGVGLLGALAFSGGGAPAHPAAQHTAAKAPSPAASEAAGATTQPQPVPPSPSAGAKSTPEATVSALRADVAQTPMPKDRQVALLKTLDAASLAIAGGQQPEAVAQLKSAQRQVRDLAKKHAVDGGVAAGWQRQLGAAINGLGNQGAGQNANPTDNPNDNEN